MKRTITTCMLLLLCQCTTNVATFAPGKIKNYAGIYKVGNPYVIDGKTYYPEVDKNYQETGIASWYGPKFHGKKTANGDIFDKHDLTAAHRTLPLPSIVKVDNLDNNKSIIVMVNDRGPFSKNRIIDLSEKAAKKIGFKDKGLARVKVTYLEQQTQKLYAQLGITEPAREIQVTKATIPNKVEDIPTPRRITSILPNKKPEAVEVVFSGDITQSGGNPFFIQAGAFGIKENAEKTVEKLKKYGDIDVKPIQTSTSTLYRVRLGPISDKNNAEWLLSAVQDEGFYDAKLIGK